MRPSAEEFAKRHTPTPAEEAAASRTVERAREAARREGRIAGALRADLDRLERSLEIALDLSRPLPAVPVRGRPSVGSKQACPIFVASDWHVEERVLASHVNGLNEYGPEVARKRAARWVEGCLWLLDTHRGGTRIDEAVLAIIGDMVTGFIHEEFVAGNAMLPTEAIEHAQELLHDSIVTLLRRAKLKALRVVCSRGNHGRTTKKTWIGSAARMSYEWLMYRSLARRFAGDRRVTFTIEDGYHTYVPVFDKVVRFHHGDAVSYQGGVGGVTIPLNKHIARTNATRWADLDVIGHFHQLTRGRAFVVNGSLIGFNDFAAWIGASIEPPQQAFVLMRPERGACDFAPVFAT